jgi:A/G-specific adenine glycosylase
LNTYRALPSYTRRRTFAQRILAWEEINGRRFSWRETREPYEVLLAEVLLQRTQANQVEHFLPAFLDQFPNPAALERAPYDEVAKAVRPFGLAKRAALIKRLAAQLLEGIPSAPEHLMRLCGVGPYTANAVACFSFGERRAVLDANVVRVLTRYFGWKTDRARPRDDPGLWRLASSLLPARGAPTYNWGLLDFSAAVCRSRDPRCEGCPLRRACSYRKTSRRSRRS